MAVITHVEKHRGLWIASFIWLVCLAAALAASALRGDGLTQQLWPYALIASVPAILGLILAPKMRQEWAQIIIVFAWLALAILACLAIAFVPMAVLFLCAPAAAALFEKEKVIEAMVLSAIFAALLFYAGQNGLIDNFNILSDGQSDWGQKVGIAGTIAFLIASLYGVAANAGNAEAPSGAVDHSMLDALPGGVIRVNRENAVSMASEPALEMLNLPDQDRLQLEDLFGIDNQSAARDFAARIREAGKPGRQVFTVRDRTAEVTATPLRDGNILFYAQDISDHEDRLENLEQTLNRAEKDAQGKSLFFAGVSHELRTPLNAIIGFSDMMRSRLFGPLPGKYAEYADLIHDSGQHMLDLIGDVLDISKVEAGKYELSYQHFDAADVIRSTVKMLRPQADSAEVQMDVEIAHDSGELLVNADRKALRQIILNLLSNAIKFTPKGGRIVVKGDIERDDLILTVEDNGAGISAEDLKTVTEPYVQTDTGKASDKRGTGLGLSLVKSFAELHQGHLDIESTLGEGTSVRVTIPKDADMS